MSCFSWHQSFKGSPEAISTIKPLSSPALRNRYLCKIDPKVNISEPEARCAARLWKGPWYTTVGLLLPKNPFYSQNPNATEPAYLIYCHQKLVMIKFRDFYKKKTAEGVLVLRLYRAGETRSPRRCSAHWTSHKAPGLSEQYYFELLIVDICLFVTERWKLGPKT